MKKSILYRLFGLGSIPKKIRPILTKENIIIADEGMGGWFITKHVTGPHKRYRNRREGFSACLVITKKRVLCYTYGKRQINISVNDLKLSRLFVNNTRDNKLTICFESSEFNDDMKGTIEFHFKTDKALEFKEVLCSLGTREGTAEDIKSANE